MLRPRVQYCTFTACPWPWRAKGKGLGGIWELWLSFTSKNLTLCPDGTKSGLQLMGTRLSSKGHLARISHTLTHTHTHTYPIPDTHMQSGLVLDLLTLFVQCGMSESLSLLVIYTLLCHVWVQLFLVTLQSFIETTYEWQFDVFVHFKHTDVHDLSLY